MVVAFMGVLLANAGVPLFLSFWAESLVVRRILRVESILFVGLFVYFLLSFYFRVFLMMRLRKHEGAPSTTRTGL
jgi:formate hydrogenlyase subunit 3/multisubunit Na+/H+ antiporter MnhD subunit